MPMLAGLSSFESIETFVSLLVDRGANVDALINKAGVTGPGGASRSTARASNHPLRRCTSATST